MFFNLGMASDPLDASYSYSENSWDVISYNNM